MPPQTPHYIASRVQRFKSTQTAGTGISPGSFSETSKGHARKACASWTTFNTSASGFRAADNVLPNSTVRDSVCLSPLDSVEGRD